MDMTMEKKAMIEGKNYRFTVLTPALIRLEYSEKGIFTDMASQTVVNRDFEVPQFRVEESEQSLSIITDCLELTYDKKAFSATGLKIRCFNAYKFFRSVWYYGDQPRDLKGTTRTLDNVDGSCELESGIFSLFGGWSLLDDSKSLLLDEKGWIKKREDKDAIDLYFFGYGERYHEGLRDYYRLTGAQPLLPRYALGNWWSRYYKYTEKSYNELMDRFEKEQVPLSVAVIDMDWHLTEIDPRYGSGWTGYTWNKEYFPDPEKFMKGLHDRGMKVTLNIHPADGIRAYEECYERMADFMGIDADSKAPIPFEIANPKFLKGYFECVHHPLEEQGVDFWWIDWQQGSNSGVEGLDPLWMLNHYHYLDNRRDGKRGLILSRYGGPGSHRYPLGFSGDTIISWESLQFQPYFTATASNIGYGWWSHDIGGHMGGSKEDELSVRWLQFGVFSPILRLHSSNNEFNGKEPWRFHKEEEQVMKKYLRLRHRLIPYLYTMNRRANQEGIPLMEPMYYHNPTTKEALPFEIKNEYYYGSQMIVCPVTTPMEKETRMAKTTGWLPEGKYLDFFTGLIYEGGRTFDFYRNLEQVPVLSPLGSIIPLDGRLEGNSLDNPTELELHVCAGADGEFTLWEDDGEAADYEEQRWASTDMRFTAGETSVFTVEAAEGNCAVVPEKRSYRIVLKGLEPGAVVSACSGEEKLSGIHVTYEEPMGFTVIELPAVRSDRRLEVTIENCQLYDNRKAQRVFDYLNQAEISFNLKSDIYDVVKKATSQSELIHALGQLQRMETKETVLGPVLEILTAL